MREVFLQVVLDDPSDTTTALVFADWLEENGEDNAAAWVRGAASQPRFDDFTCGWEMWRDCGASFVFRGVRSVEINDREPKSGEWYTWTDLIYEPDRSEIPHGWVVYMPHDNTISKENKYTEIGRAGKSGALAELNRAAYRHAYDQMLQRVGFPMVC